jgi:hypothetical protein
MYPPVSVLRRPLGESERFAHQREYRIAAESPGTEPLILDIGGITDITSEVIPFSDANNCSSFQKMTPVRRLCSGSFHLANTPHNGGQHLLTFH